MRAQDKSHLLQVYRQSLARHGDTAEAVQWRQDSQRRRFQVLTEIADLERARILDYGCGKGDLYQYLQERGFRGSYSGFDINLDLLELARRKHPGVRFEICDIEEDKVTEQFDYVLISGMFNNRISDNWAWMRSALRKCFSCATRGLAFNAISTYVNYHEEQMFYASPEETFRFCVTQLSHSVTVRHNVPPYNFTLYVYREAEWKT